MADSAETFVRAFDGSLTDAEGILAVERATFDESPYHAEQVRAMLRSTASLCLDGTGQAEAVAEGPQRAWLAIGGDRVVGFAIAFPTHGLRGWWWEVDLLAILPDWRGRRLATRLIRATAAFGASLVCRARAVVATDNHASARAFSRAGFRAEPGTCELLIHRLEGQRPGCWSTPAEYPAACPERRHGEYRFRGGVPVRWVGRFQGGGIVIREAISLAEARNWLRDPPPEAIECPAPGGSAPRESFGQTAEGPRGRDLPSLGGCPEPTLLLADQNGRPAGYAELIEVQTLLYRGVWIESLVASDRTVREALIREATNWAKAAGLDEIGVMVPEENRPLQQSLLAQGFRSLGDYRWFGAQLPLSDFTPPLLAAGD